MKVDAALGYFCVFVALIIYERCPPGHGDHGDTGQWSPGLRCNEHTHTDTGLSVKCDNHT